jgi:hypothetical protein
MAKTRKEKQIAELKRDLSIRINIAERNSHIAMEILKEIEALERA